MRPTRYARACALALVGASVLLGSCGTSLTAEDLAEQDADAQVNDLQRDLTYQLKGDTFSAHGDVLTYLQGTTDILEADINAGIYLVQLVGMGESGGSWGFEQAEVSRCLTLVVDLEHRSYDHTTEQCPARG